MLGECEVLLTTPKLPELDIEEPTATYIFSTDTEINSVYISDGNDFAVALIIDGTVFMTGKEKLDMELSQKLRTDGIITTPGKEFEQSSAVEWDGLKTKKVFEIIEYDEKTMAGIRIFRTRLVHEIKGKATAEPYEKTRLVLCGHSDQEKQHILTQAPTIQRSSQRLILVFAPSLSPECELYLRDITQAYVQSITSIVRTIIATLPKEFRDKYPPGSLMRILKPLYGIAEAGTHWHITYLGHHLNELDMEQSTYDSCLLITKDPEVFGVVGMQTDDTLILGNKKFATLEDEKLATANFDAKPHQKLTKEEPILFNGCTLSKGEGRNLILTQKGQGKNIELVDFNSPTLKKDYSGQQARGAYIAGICQPEAAFDMSSAAQHQDPSEQNVKDLNERLQWQKDNLDRGVTFVPIDLETAQMYVFVDAAFANNEDYTSQLGICIMIGNETRGFETFTVRGNLFYWSSVKCKRVTRAVLASELYAMVQGADMAIAVSTTIDMITKQLEIPDIPIVICTDSKSLYECMVKLGTTKEKRLMIDIMALRQSYERREFTEVRWIKGDDNPADALTKSNPNKALKNLIDCNEIQI